MSVFGFTLTAIKDVLVAVLDIAIIWFILYYALKIVRNNQRTIQIFKGILFVVLIDGVAKILGLRTVQYLADIFVNWGLLAIIIIFQPELRSLLERLGKSNVFSKISSLSGNQKEKLVDQIVTAVMLLSKDQTGALISIEQSHSLEDFIATGTRMNSDVTAELLTSIFVTSTPLHDGAVIIQGDRIACASAYFPPTTRELPTRYGARHRAAIGISEISDAVTVVVSEETGTVSIAHAGELQAVDRKQLKDYLTRVICDEDETVTASIDTGRIRLEEEKAPVRKKSVFSRFAVRRQSAVEADNEAADLEVEEIRPAQTVQQNPSGMTQADQEAINAKIKLPHKKERPTPSYPQQSGRPRNMTPEEVRAAREQQVKNLSASTEEEKVYDTSMLNISKIVGFNNELDDTFTMVDQIDRGSSGKEGGDAE